MRTMLKERKLYNVAEKIQPKLFWLATNALGAYGLNRALDEIAEHSDSHEGLTFSLTYASWIAGQFWLNKKLLIPTARKIKQKYQRRRRTEKKLNLLGKLRLAGATASLVAVLSSSSFQRTINAVEYDARCRVQQSLS